jgi:hypothetical protein
LFVSPTALTAYIAGQQGTPKGLLYANKLNFAPRFEIAKQIPRAGLVVRAGYGIFYTPIDMNTWCNNLPEITSDAFRRWYPKFRLQPQMQEPLRKAA